MVDEHPRFYVLEIAPGPRSRLWLYLTVGASTLRPVGEPALEFILACPIQTSRGVELTTMIARYHRNRGLGKGHTLPLDESWLPGATCDHMLVTVPYPWGPKLEVIDTEDRHVHVLWLLPITQAERDFKATRGLEALESLFEANALKYWRVDRPSLVPGGH